MHRIAYMVLREPFRAVYYFSKICKCSRDESISYETGYEWIRKTSILANKAGRVTIESHGTENIPDKDGFVIFPNHQGLFDMLAVFASCHRPFAFVLKKEVSNIILLKQVSKALGSLAIDREDIRQSMTVIQTMTEEVKKGRNFLIFAEGTRSRQGNVPLEFKGGSFKSAVKAKCPIVPCALINSFVPFDQKGCKPVTVKVIYLKPMEYEEYRGMKTVEIAEEVRRRIVEAIAKYEKE